MMPLISSIITMNALEYYQSLGNASQIVLNDSLSDTQLLGNVYDFSASLRHFGIILKHYQEHVILLHAAEQLDFSCVSMLLGMYRQAFSTLRLTVEMALSFVQFSTNLLNFKEWQAGSQDINWRSLTDRENGVFSIRYTNIFFPELHDHIDSNIIRANTLYRDLSEQVHGNANTWSLEHPHLHKNNDLISSYASFIKEARYLTIGAISRFV